MGSGKCLIKLYVHNGMPGSQYKVLIKIEINLIYTIHTLQ